MYFIDNKLCLICVLVITSNSYFINCSTLSTIFIPGSDLDLNTFLTMATEACNIKGCFSPRQFYFVEDPFIICPAGFDLKLAFKDQEGRYRVGSINTKQSKKKILENCKNNPKSAAPNYMKSTASTEAKIRTKYFTPITRTQPKKASTQLPHSNIIQKEDLATTNFASSIMTDDESDISDESFTTAQLSLEDSLYLNHSFPQNMFDDKGDIIYGTGLLGLLLSFICTLIKLILEKQKNKELSDLPQHLPKTSSPQRSNNRNQYSVLNNQHYMHPTAHSTALATNETTNQHYHTALAHPTTASQFVAFPLNDTNTQQSRVLVTSQLPAPLSNVTNNKHYHEALPHPPTASQLAAFPLNDTNTQHSRVLVTSQLPASLSNVTNNQHFHAALPHPPNASQLAQDSRVLITSQAAPVSNVIAQQFARVTLKPNCNCPTGCCTKGKCHCYMARRACGPTCHGGNGTSLNCKATLEHVARFYN